MTGHHIYQLHSTHRVSGTSAKNNKHVVAKLLLKVEHMPRKTSRNEALDKCSINQSVSNQLCDYIGPPSNPKCHVVSFLQFQTLWAN